MVSLSASSCRGRGTVTLVKAIKRRTSRSGPRKITRRSVQQADQRLSIAAHRLRE